MQKRVALYARVSTGQNQTVENQLRDLRAVAARLGWIVVAVFTDEGISGAMGREQRPGYDALLKGIARREFGLIAAWSVSPPRSLASGPRGLPRRCSEPAGRAQPSRSGARHHNARRSCAVRDALGLLRVRASHDLGSCAGGA